MPVVTAPSIAGWNLGLRFALELTALVGFAVAAWKLTDGAWRWVAVHRGTAGRRRRLGRVQRARRSEPLG